MPLVETVTLHFFEKGMTFPTYPQPKVDSRAVKSFNPCETVHFMYREIKNSQLQQTFWF